MNNKENIENENVVTNKEQNLVSENNIVAQQVPQEIQEPVQEVPVEQPINAEVPVEVTPVPSEEAQVSTEEVQQVVNPAPVNHVQNNAFNSQETVLYEIKEEKEGNPLIVLMFFVILIVFIFLLPSISTKVTEFVKTPTQKPVATAPVIEEEEETKYELNSSQIRATVDNLDFTNIVTSHQNDKYEINFTIINNGDEAYTFNKKYYIQFYDEEKLVYRSLIYSYEPLASKASTEMSLIISQKAYDEATSFNIEEINQGKYPDVNITATEDGYNTLTCTYKNDEIKYYFKDKMLEKMKQTYIETTASTSYQASKVNYQSLSQRYTQINGITSTFVESPTDFTLINEFDLANIQDKTLSDLQVYKYFNFRTKDSVISFEMAAIGYQCS